MDKGYGRHYMGIYNIYRRKPSKIIFPLAFQATERD